MKRRTPHDLGCCLYDSCVRIPLTMSVRLNQGGELLCCLLASGLIGCASQSESAERTLPSGGSPPAAPTNGGGGSGGSEPIAGPPPAPTSVPTSVVQVPAGGGSVGAGGTNGGSGGNAGDGAAGRTVTENCAM